MKTYLASLEDYEEIAGSPEGWIESLKILAEYLPNGMKSKYFLEAEHDIIYSHVDAFEIPVESKDGLVLEALGWHLNTDTDCWAYFT